MKRLIDLALVILSSPLWVPLLVVTAVVVALFLGRPVFFRQERPGRGERLFQLIKFRTMTEAREACGRLKPDADRLTAFGRFLRSTSLDELPELWNVLRGEMSLVGPRPLLPEYLPRYSAEQRRRHTVRPGLTGWAQVNGRNGDTWAERFERDLWYVDNQSIVLDFRILAMTLLQVVRREGVSQPGRPTRDPFQGNEQSGSDGSAPGGQ